MEHAAESADRRQSEASKKKTKGKVVGKRRPQAKPDFAEIAKRIKQGKKITGIVQIWSSKICVSSSVL
jgi:hypothetical protein